MLRRSRRSSIAFTLLFFFVFSIACCMPVGMAEDPPPVGGGGGGGGALAIPILSINPSSVTVPFDGTISITIYDSQTDLWTGSEPLALHLYNADAYGYAVGESIAGWFSANDGFSVTDSNLTVELNLLPLLQPGSYVFIVAPDNNEGTPTPLGMARLTVEGDTATTPVTLTATPDHGLPGNTISIILAEPVDNDLWSIQDPVMPRLVTPANPTAGSMPVQDANFDNVVVSDDSISADLNLAATVAPGQYVIEVLLGEAVIGTAFFEVDDNELPVGTSTAWLNTSSYETGQTWSTGSVRASVANGSLKLGVNVENVSFTNGTFDLEYDPTIVNNPSLSYYRDGFTSCNMEIWPQENGMNTVHVEFYGATSIGPASNDPYSSDWPTLFELNFTAKQEGTLALSLWHMKLPGAQPETCILDLFNDAGFVGYGPKAYNDEPVLFTFTDKDNVVYVYDMNSGEPLIGNVNAVMNDNSRVPQNVIADPYGGYFFNNVTGAQDFELLVTGYDSISLGTSAYHNVLGRSPSMLGFSPHMSRPSTNDMHYTCYLPGIGSDFDTSSYTYELYYRDSNDEPQFLSKNINFSAGDDEDQIKVTFVGGLQILNDEDYQLYDLYIYKDGEFLGRGYLVVDENFCPYLVTDPDTVASDYTGYITIKGFEGMQGPEPVPWVANDNLNLQLWLYNPQTQQPENTGLVPTVGAVTDTDLTFTLPPNLPENRYIIYVLRGSDRIAEAHISVENGQSIQPAVIPLTPSQVLIGGELSFTFDLSAVTLQNSPYAVIVKPSGDPDVQPAPVTGVAAVTQPETGGYQAAFTDTINEAGSYLLVIFDGQPTDPANLPPVAAIGPLQVVDPNALVINVTPSQVNIGDPLSFSFELPGPAPQNTPYAMIFKPAAQPGGQPTPMTSGVALTQLGTGYQVTFSETINDAGVYFLVVFDGPIDFQSPPPVLGTGLFQVVTPSSPTVISISPNQVNTGDSLSFTFDLSGVTLQNSPYAVIVEQPSDPGVQPPPVTGVATVTGLEAGGYQVAFSETIDVAGNYLLVIFDGLPTDPANLPPIAALGPFVVVANTNVLNLVLSPDYALIGTAPSFEFTVPSEFTMPEEPYGLILKPGESPVPVGNSALLDTETVGDEIYYTFYNGEAINEMGNYELHIFDGQPVEGSQPIAIGKFNVVPAFLPLSPPILTAGEQVSLAFDIPTNIPAADTRYAMLVEDTPEHQPVSGVTPVAITPASGSDSMWLATWPAELQLEPGNYLLAIFNVPPTMDTAPVAFGLFTVEPAFFRLVNEKLPPANVNQLYEATVEVANGTSPYTWELKAPVGATLPQDMALVAETDTSKAKLSFTPSEYGVLPIVIEVTDSSEEPQTVSQLYNLRILPPLFTLTPNKIVKGDPINFEFSLPPGVTVNNPYAVLGNLDTGFSSPAVRVSSSEGICQVSFYPWMLEDQPSGEYYVGIMEGMPQQDTRCLAAGKFDYVQLPWVNANPDPVLMPYPSGQNISLEEPSNIPLLWNENDDLTLQFFRQEWQQDIMTLTSVPFSGSVQVLGNIINFTLPDEWAEGWYQVQVYRGEERIAISSFSVNYPWFDVTPGGIPAYFRQSPVIELWENQYEIWNAADTLEVHLVNNTGPDPESCERVLEATIPNNALFIADDVIRFNLPASIDCGYHDVELFRGDKLIARGSLNINAPQCGVQPRPLFIDAQNKTVSLHKDDPETWHASEAGQLKLDIHQKTYYGPEPWQYNLEYKQTIESANLTVSEDTISFVFPETLNKGRYELILQRKINADFWRTVGWGDLLYTDPFINLPISSDVLSGDPPAVREGYELPINFTLTDTGGAAWSAGEPLNLNLFHFYPIDKTWNLLPPHMQPYDVVVGEDSISAKLPPGIWAGDYTISVSRANTVPPDEFALAQFRVLPLLELEAVNLPPAQVNQPYFGTVKVKGGTAPYYWSINALPPEFQWPVGNTEWYPNQNDSSQLIITGTFTEPGVYPLEIRVEDNDGRVSYHPIQLVVREGMPRVIAGIAAGLPGREVIVPIMGENLTGTGVSGIQFTLDYDPAVATIATDGVLPGMIPDTTIESNIDNVNGHAIISIAWSQPLPEQVSFAEFCRIKFQINSNPANANCMVYLNDVDGTILSHGEYDIPAETINGSIRAASYGDVNGNGKVDVGDAVLILRHSAGIITLPEPLIELANVDDIDGVGPTDAILILKKVVRLIDHFPVELPVVF